MVGDVRPQGSWCSEKRKKKTRAKTWPQRRTERKEGQNIVLLPTDKSNWMVVLQPRLWQPFWWEHVHEAREESRKPISNADKLINCGNIQASSGIGYVLPTKRFICCNGSAPGFYGLPKKLQARRSPSTDHCTSPFQISCTSHREDANSCPKKVDHFVQLASEVSIYRNWSLVMLDVMPLFSTVPV